MEALATHSPVDVKKFFDELESALKTKYALELPHGSDAYFAMGEIMSTFQKVLEAPHLNEALLKLVRAWFLEEENLPF